MVPILPRGLALAGTHMHHVHLTKKFSLALMDCDGYGH